MKKNKIILSHNSNFKKYENSLFLDEYVQKIFSGFNPRFEKNNFFISIENYKKKNLYSKLLFKKLKKYRYELSQFLNKTHNTKNDQKYWGIMLDSFLLFLINSIIIDLKFIKRLKNKKKKFFLDQFSFNNFYYGTWDFDSKFWEDNRQAIVRATIFDAINLSNQKQKKKQSENFRFVNNLNQKKIFKNIIIFFSRFYIKLFKPILILDGYFGIKTFIKVFLLSFGRVIIIPSGFVFYEKNFNIKINQTVRKKIKIKEKDLVDKIFNELIGRMLPASFLELFKIYNNNISLSKNIKKLGTAVSLNCADEFKYLAAEIKKRKGKILHFQHGGIDGDTQKKQIEAIVNRNHSDEQFFWKESNKKCVNNYLSRFDETKAINFESNKQILILLTRCLLKQNYSKPSFLRNHPFLRYSLKFYEKLNSKLKKNSLIRVFPSSKNNHIEEQIIKKIWINKFGNNISIDIRNKKILELYYNSKVVILEEISTSFYELLYLNIPFIVIADEHQFFKKKFSMDYLKLSKVNIIFDKPEEAAKFINKNYNKLDSWWSKVLKDKIYNDFKKKYLPEKFQTRKFISEVLS